ncbi:MAG TPA: hypothetical protein VG817_06175, partial [Gemmatimonadales bacterium]|nr:hypothetical protein [Gemmatimonadales bacterium]
PMRLTTARGITLVELLVGLLLLAVVGAALARTALGMSRALSRLQGRAAVQANLDAATGWLSAELEELGPGDLQGSGDTLRYRAVRFAGLGCHVTPSALTLELQRGVTGRSIQPGRDSLLVLVDSIWQPFPVENVTIGNCEGATDSLVPVRGFERMQARFYQSGGAWWLGGRSESAGEGVQPLAGPFLPGRAWTRSDSAVSITVRDSSRTDSAFAYLAWLRAWP